MAKKIKDTLVGKNEKEKANLKADAIIKALKKGKFKMTHAK
jgi:hypothetical protein